MSDHQVNTDPSPEAALYPEAMFFADLYKAQSEIKAAAKDATNPHFRNKYADLPELISVARPALNKYGISLIQEPETDLEKEAVGITTVLAHASGYKYVSKTLWIPVAKFDAQGIGSATTYGCRYQLRAIVAIETDEPDDDGEAAVGRSQTAYYKPSKPSAPDTRSMKEANTPEKAITADERLALIRLIEGTNTDISKFLSAYSASSLESFPARQFASAHEILTKKLIKVKSTEAPNG